MGLQILSSLLPKPLTVFSKCELKRKIGKKWFPQLEVLTFEIKEKKKKTTLINVMDILNTTQENIGRITFLWVFPCLRVKY